MPYPDTASREIKALRDENSKNKTRNTPLLRGEGDQRETGVCLHSIVVIQPTPIPSKEGNSKKLQKTKLPKRNTPHATNATVQ